MKVCPLCGQAKDEAAFPRAVSRHGASYLRKNCRACEKERMARYNTGAAKTGHNKRWQDKHPERRKAHKAVEYALLRGDLVRLPCECCGATERIHAHHDDYTKPLEVMWLCHPCHGARHSLLRAQSRDAA